MIVNQKDSGVSPVVGVILMVAVTVILAAVIGSFVLDLGSSVSQSAQAGVSFDEDVASGDVDVQLTTVQAADSIWVTSSGGAGFDTAAGLTTGDFSGTDVPGPYDGSSSTASQYLLSRQGGGGPGTIVSYTGGSEGDQLSVIGEVEGESSVIQTYTLGS